MIRIEERPTEKVTGKSSLFIKTEYKKEYVDLFKSLDGSSYNKKTKEWEVPLTHLSTILDSLCVYEDLDLTFLEDKSNKGTSQEVILNTEKYKTQPFNYQKDGILYGLTHKKWLLLDMPGLGKTYQTLHIAEELKNRENIKHCLIICGVNTLKENWRNEVKKHTNLSCCILGEKTRKNGSHYIGSIQDRLTHLKTNINEFFVITNIETLRNDDILKEINNGVNNFDLILFDECHKAKNSQSEQGKNLLKLNKATYKIGMTGTLLLNNPLDAYVPLKWIDAEKSTLTNFKNYYCIFGGPMHNMLIGFKNTKYLKDIIEENSLRRKKELLNLPPKTIINEYVEMESDQEKFYDNIKNGVREEVNKVRLNTTNLLASTARLRQATACPSILTTENIQSSKINRAVDLVDEIIQNNNKVVIFSTFKETCYELGKLLNKYSPLICTGDQKDSEINKNIELFQNNDNYKLFICTHQKMGTGVTLTSASYEIFIDTPWTNALYEQAQDRCYRIGTTKNVTIYHLITKNTIDERVLEILEDKEAIADYIIDNEINDKGINSLKKYIEDL